MAALTSCVMDSRKRFYSKPCGPNYSAVTTPTAPSISAEMYIFIFLSCASTVTAKLISNSIKKIMGDFIHISFSLCNLPAGKKSMHERYIVF